MAVIELAAPPASPTGKVSHTVVRLGAGVLHCHIIGNFTATGFVNDDFHYLSIPRIALGGRLIKDVNVL